MAEEADGVIEEVGGQLRIALMTATQIAEKFARLREDLARQQQARTEQQTRELRVRFDAERDAARAAVAPTSRPEWWATATVDDIAEAYQTAHAWEPVDEDLAQRAAHMRDEVQARYGVEVDGANVTGGDDTLRAALSVAAERAEQQHPGAEDPMRRMLTDLEAGRADARKMVDPVYQDEWWQQASVDDIAAAYEAAHAWEDTDTDIAAHAQQMRYEIQNRYGVDVAAMHDRPEALAPAIADVRREQEPSPVRDAMRAFDAERDAARGEISAAGDPQWWEASTPEQIAATYEKAAAWEAVDPEVARTAEQMRTELRDRYGVDNPQAGQSALREALERDERTRGDAAHQRSESGVDVVEAGALMATADRLDREGERRDRELYERNQATLTGDDADASPATILGGDSSDRGVLALSVQDTEQAPGGRGDGSAEHTEADAYRDAGEDAYDSAERREAWADDMESEGLTADQVQGRIAADRNQATHPREAVRTKPRTSKGRGKGQSQGMQRERGGLSR